MLKQQETVDCFCGAIWYEVSKPPGNSAWGMRSQIPKKKRTWNSILLSKLHMENALHVLDERLHFPHNHIFFMVFRFYLSLSEDGND